jgi:hypothetical protein
MVLAGLLLDHVQVSILGSYISAEKFPDKLLNYIFGQSFNQQLHTESPKKPFL